MFRPRPHVSAKAISSKCRAADIDSLGVRRCPHGPGPRGLLSSPPVFHRHSLCTDEETEAQRVGLAERRVCLTLLQSEGTRGAFPRPLSVVRPPRVVRRLRSGGELGLSRESSPLPDSTLALLPGGERGWGATRRAFLTHLIPRAEQGRVSPRLPQAGLSLWSTQSAAANLTTRGVRQLSPPLRNAPLRPFF